MSPSYPSPVQCQLGYIDPLQLLSWRSAHGISCSQWGCVSLDGVCDGLGGAEFESSTLSNLNYSGNQGHRRFMDVKDFRLENISDMGIRSLAYT